MFKNMKLATKISTGFGALIVIALILGGIAVVNMNSVKTQSVMLAEEYVPEVDIATELQNAANALMFEMRAYGYTEEEEFWQKAEVELKNIATHLEQAKELNKNAKNLHKLGSQIKVAENSLQEYTQLSNQTRDLNRKLSENRNEMNRTAAVYMNTCAEFLEGQTRRMEQEIKQNRTNTARLNKITIVNNIIDEGNAVRVGNFKAQATRDPQSFQQSLDRFKTKFGLFNDLRQYTKLAADLKNIDITEEAAKEYATAMTDFLHNWKEREEVGAERLIAANAFLAACDETAGAGMEQTNTIATNAASSLSASSNIMVVGLIMALLIGVALALFITRSITGPINRVIDGLATGGEQVASASEQLSSSSQQMSQGASEQASSLEEVSSSLEEMASMTKQNSENTRQVNSMAGDAKDAANQGTEAMGRLSKAISQIKTSSDETSKIIKTIDEIAMQTNLLALNAAVEAARAGEAGRGFAVVAEEVRNLAQRSAEAAKNTAQLIEGSRTNTENGVQVSAEVSELLTTISERAQKVAQLSSEVSAASEEQSQGIDQVNGAVAQMDQVTQTNAANAEESASASEELSGQAQNLNAMVEELVAIVGSRTDRSSQQGGGFGSSVKKHLPLVQHNSAGKIVQSQKQISKSAQSQRQPVSVSKEVKPAQVLPLDSEEDFSDF